jgi:hypothetical protein
MRLRSCVPAWYGISACGDKKGHLVHFAFRSSHVRDDYAASRLTVDMQRLDPATGSLTADHIYFEIPSDFHVHNDLVAAALLTLVGNQARRVEFNFPISEHCAATLRQFYGELEAVGPVDPTLAPRRRGRYYGLNFSGGLDSTAVWLLLREVLGDEFRTITTEYGGYFTFEAQGYTSIPRDVSCRTDFRLKRYDRGGRFNSCVTLLFADHLDLRAQVTGHPYALGSTLESLRDGREPRFLSHDLALLAGGLEELHLMRSLNNAGPLLVLAALAPERVPAAFSASAVPGTEKHYTKGWLLRFAFERLGLDPPQQLREITPPRRPIRWGEAFGIDTRVLQIAKQRGWATGLRMCPGMHRVDRATFDGLSLRFLWRYNTNMLQLVPGALRGSLLDVFHRSGIEPYDETDYDELERLRGLLANAGVSYDPTTPVSPPPERALPEPTRLGG